MGEKLRPPKPTVSFIALLGRPRLSLTSFRLFLNNLCKCSESLIDGGRIREYFSYIWIKENDIGTFLIVLEELAPHTSGEIVFGTHVVIVFRTGLSTHIGSFHYV